MLFWRTGNDFSTLFKIVSNRNSGRFLAYTETLSIPYYSSRLHVKSLYHNNDFHKPTIKHFDPPSSNWHAVVQNLLRSNAPTGTIRSTLQIVMQTETPSTKQICLFIQDIIKTHSYDYAIDIVRLTNMADLKMRHNEYEQITFQFTTLKKWHLVHSITNLAYNHTGKWSLRLLNWHLRSCIEIQDYGFLLTVPDQFHTTSFKLSRRTFNLIIEGHLRNSDLASARRALVAMQEAGFVLDKSTYSLVLSNYPTLGHNQSVEKQAFETLKNTGHASDTMVLNGLLHARIAALDIIGVLRLIKLLDVSPTNTKPSGYQKSTGVDFLSTFDDIPSRPLAKIKPNQATFNIILTMLAYRKADTARILVIYDSMKKMGFHPDATTVAAIILAYGNEEKSEIALSIVYNLCKANGLPVQREFFVSLGALSDIKNAVETFPGITSVPPNIWIFNALLRVFLPSMGLPGLHKFLNLLQSVNVIPDFTTTQIILTYLRDHHRARPQMLVEVLQSLTNFRSGESILTVEHLNTILASYIHRELDLIHPRSWNATSQQVRFRQSPRFYVKNIHHSTSIFDPTAGISYRSFPQKGVRLMLRDMIKSLCARNVKSSRATFALRIRREGVIKRDLQMAQSIFDLMVSRGIRPNKYHYSAMVEGYAGIGMMEQAKQVMEQAYTDGVKPNLIMYSILIQGYARLGLPDLAKDTFKDMIKSGVVPDIAALDSLVGAYWFIKRSKTARNILLDLWPEGIPFPEHLQTASLRDLIVYLRSQRKDQRRIPLSRKFHNQPSHQQELRLSLRKILTDVKQWQQVETAVTWTQNSIAWDYILHSNDV